MGKHTPTKAEAKWVMIGPELAYRLLESNTANRNIRQRRVEQYSRDMKAGRWVQNGDTLKFSPDGTLLDGQHRLWAVVEANREIEFLVVEGVDPSVMPTIDTGATRGFQDVASINGYPNATLLASVTRMLYWYDYLRDTYSAPRGTNMSHGMLQEYLDQHPDTVDYVRDVANTTRLRAIITPTAVGFVYVVAARQDPEKAAEWLKSLATGADLYPGHPVYVLRERLLAMRAGSRTRVDAMMASALALKSWMAFRDRQPIQILVWKSGEDFPDADKNLRVRVRTKTKKEYVDALANKANGTGEIPRIARKRKPGPLFQEGNSRGRAKETI
jgi:hypothetical protein